MIDVVLNSELLHHAATFRPLKLYLIQLVLGWAQQKVSCGMGVGVGGVGGCLLGQYGRGQPVGAGLGAAGGKSWVVFVGNLFLDRAWPAGFGGETSQQSLRIGVGSTSHTAGSERPELSTSGL